LPTAAQGLASSPNSLLPTFGFKHWLTAIEYVFACLDNPTILEAAFTPSYFLLTSQ